MTFVVPERIHPLQPQHEHGIPYYLHDLRFIGFEWYDPAVPSVADSDGADDDQEILTWITQCHADCIACKLNLPLMLSQLSVPV